MLDEFWVHETRIHKGSDVYGNPSPDGVIVYGFQTHRVRMVRTPNGEETTSTAKVSYPSGTNITLDDWVTLDGETRPRQVVALANSTSGALELPDRLGVYLA